MYKPDFIAANPKDIILPEDEFAGYIFDCDGTVADTMSLHYAAWRDALEAAQDTFELDVDTFFSMAGMGLKETVHALNKRYGTNIDAEAFAIDKRIRMKRLMSRIVPIESVFAFAKKVAEDGRAISIASGGTKEVVQETLRIIGASDLFPVVICHEDVKNGKPAPDIFLLAAEKMGVKPKDCIVFEDSLLGIEGAAKAGMKSILIGRELSNFTANLV